MDVGTAIGENHRFELREALLIYCESRNAAFVTRHQVLKDKSGVPSLGPAAPLTVNFVEELVRSLEGRTGTERIDLREMCFEALEAIDIE